MAQQPGDLQHVQAVLEGRAPVAPSPRAAGQQQRRGRARTPQASRQNRSGAGAESSVNGRGRQQEQRHEPGNVPVQSRGKQQGRVVRSRSQGRKRQQPYPRAEQEQQEEEGQAEQRQPPASPYSQPGPKSTPRVWHCTACDVWVPRREGDWETHTRGIRHQRQLLSLRVHGERGKLVLSAFESLPGPSEPAHRLVGKAAQQFGLLGGGPSTPARASGSSMGLAGPGSSLTAQQREVVRGLRTQALTQLLHLYGVGQTYNDAAQSFSEPDLAHALAEVVGLRGLLGSIAAMKVPASQPCSLRMESGCLLAVASQLLLQQPELLPSQVSLQLGAKETVPFAQVASELAGLRMLLPVLGACPALAHLTVTLRQQGLHLLPGYQLSQLQRAWGGHVVRSLGGILELNPSLRSIKLEVPSPLLDATQQQLPTLRRAARAAPLACRQHLLLALHPRVGRCSVLQLLPLQLLREVMQLAAPLEPCRIQVRESPGPAD